MTNSLWKPPKEVQDQIRYGNQVVRLGGVEVLNVDCPYCHRSVRVNVLRNQLITNGGSPHMCKGMKKVVNKKGLAKLDDKISKLIRWKKSQ